MRRLFLALVALMTLAACTPNEAAQWSAWHRNDPRGAATWADTAVLHRALHGRGRCGQWHDTAIAAGFSESQWPTVDRIMHRESRCLPGVHNRAGANGLMQIMSMWADDCGTTVAGLRTATINLVCARHVLDAQGWQAWSTY